jgi:hypothetical protein
MRLSPHHLRPSFFRKLIQLVQKLCPRHDDRFRAQILLDFGYDVVITRLLQVGEHDRLSILLRFASREP